MRLENESFVGSTVMPWKLLQRHGELVSKDEIVPYCVQIFPTFKCNGKCRWCDYRGLDRSVELTAGELRGIADHFRKLGTRAFVLSGGGEPTMHEGLDEFIAYAHGAGFHLGVVTNGLKWGARGEVLPANGKVVWVRMSIIDTETGKYDVKRLARLAAGLPDAEIGVSFTVTNAVDVGTALGLMDIVESTGNITHIKFVEDIINFAPEGMARIRETCGPISEKCIFQDRLSREQGAERCLVSLLKPTIGADGYVYPCGCVQFVRGGDDYDFTMPKEFRMARWNEFSRSTPPFNGAICRRCPFDRHNRILAGLRTEFKHERFI
ncbi:MAG: radical SAM protein [Planctomycetota bacterium]|jgi:MoaA/NifB/PqqE/SkfB family radical SAM enzyme|nr:radical SAM protein [Planctomycetota bacterium]